MTEVLPLRIRRRLASKCLRGCDEPLVEDSDFCRAHHEEAKRLTRESAARRRDTLRKAKKCIDCGVPSRKSRCRSCREKSSKARRDWRNVNSGRRNVETPEQISDPTWRADSDGWLRYRGRARRGPPQMATLDGQDLEYAADAIAKAKHGWELTQTESVRALPRIQRDAADRTWLAFLDLAERFFDDIRARHRIGT